MLHVAVAESAPLVVDELAEVFRSVTADPFDPEWVAVPTAAMRRWIALELAARLGASPGGSDGIAANIRFEFPGVLPRLIYEAGEADHALAVQRWRSDRLPWSVLRVLEGHRDDPHLGPLAAMESATTPLSAAQRVATLFDRYHQHRPEMVRHWAAGRDLDALGAPLGVDHRWQPYLWRLVRHEIGVASLPEALPAHLARLRSAELEVDLPSRIAVVGLANLPGGASYLEVLEALSAHRNVHVVLIAPSVAAFASAAQLRAPSATARLRSEVDFDRDGSHPLGRSWGRLHFETALLLADAGIPVSHRAAPRSPAAGTRLATFRAAVRADLDPRSDSGGDDPRPGPPASDSSVQFHACHGMTRQVEVLRDALLHLFVADPTLTEDDVVVVCPSIDRFEPVIRAVLGPSVDAGSSVHNEAVAAPALRYRITDRSIRALNPILSALEVLLEAAAGRFEASTVLDLLAMGPLRRRFGLGEDDLGRIADWVQATTVRWGLDAEDRVRFGLPRELNAYTWRHGLDQVLVGAAVRADGEDGEFAIGETAPVDVDGDDVSVLAAFSSVLAHFDILATEARQPRPIDEWVQLLEGLIDDLLAAEPDNDWQTRAAIDALHLVVARSEGVEGPSPVAVSFDDLRLALSDAFAGAPGRPDHFRGGVTITSIRPMGWLPFRVVCLLGMDQASLGAEGVDADDVLAQTALIGDRDPRAEFRQSLLSVVVSAVDHLIVVRDGHDVLTNQTVPQAVPVAELHDALLGSTRSSIPGTAARIEVDHPRQAYDVRCFEPGALGVAGAWSFDPLAAAGAQARQQRDGIASPFLTAPLEPTPTDSISLDDLRAVLIHPIRGFLTRRLEVGIGGSEDPASSLLPVVLDPLEEWAAGDRLLRMRRDGHTVAEWTRYESFRGSLPPGRLGDTTEQALAEEVESMLDSYELLGGGRDEPTPVNVTLPSGVQLHGEANRAVGPTPDGQFSGDGPGSIRFTRPRPDRFITPWIDLMMLTACWPETTWRALIVRRAPKRDGQPTVDHLGVAGRDPSERHSTAIAALTLAVDAYRRALSEPIPLFPKLSRRLVVDDGTPIRSAWSSQHGFGDQRDAAVALAYGSYGFNELMQLPARTDDPPGAVPGRVQRFAAWFWGGLGDSVVALGEGGGRHGG